MLLLAVLKSLLSLHYVPVYNSVVPSQTSLLLLLLSRVSRVQLRVTP